MKAHTMIPIQALTAVTARLKAQGFKFRIRYRGARRPGKGDCLRQDATAFTVYFQ